jgi:hypothetical protein
MTSTSSRSVGCCVGMPTQRRCVQAATPRDHSLASANLCAAYSRISSSVTQGPVRLRIRDAVMGTLTPLQILNGRLHRINLPFWKRLWFSGHDWSLPPEGKAFGWTACH